MLSVVFLYFILRSVILSIAFLFLGKPSDDSTHPDYAPSLYLSEVDLKLSPTSTVKRHKSKVARFNRNTTKQRRLFSKPNVNENSANVQIDEPISTKQCETPAVSSEEKNVNSVDCERCRSLELEINCLRKERDDLKNRLLNTSFTYQNLSDKKLKYFTGIPSLTVFLWIFNLVSDVISDRRIICKQDQLLLTLLKLRLGLGNLDIAYRFGISASTVSSIFNEIVIGLSARLDFLLVWPSKEVLLKNMPHKFKPRFKNCRVIIDCTEFFIERPYNLTARAQTWSNYKHHNTLKALIGITPYGVISFVSTLYGGRISDKEITEKSGFYRKIEHGDQVMADRGFLIANELAKRGATLVMPPFIKGRKQLPGHVVGRARQLSALRIHVERAIERIKNYRILSSTIPISLVPLSSDIVKVCGALTNLQNKLVK